MNTDIEEIFNAIFKENSLDPLFTELKQILLKDDIKSIFISTDFNNFQISYLSKDSSHLELIKQLYSRESNLLFVQINSTNFSLIYYLDKSEKKDIEKYQSFLKYFYNKDKKYILTKLSIENRRPEEMINFYTKNIEDTIKNMNFEEFTNDLCKEFDNLMRKDSIDVNTLFYFCIYIFANVYDIASWKHEHYIIKLYDEVPYDKIFSREFISKYFYMNRYITPIQLFYNFFKYFNILDKYIDAVEIYSKKIEEITSQFNIIISKIINFYIIAHEELKNLKNITNIDFKQSKDSKFDTISENMEMEYDIIIENSFSDGRKYKFLNVSQNFRKLKINYSNFINMSIFENEDEYISKIEEFKQIYDYGISLYKDIIS